MDLVRPFVLRHPSVRGALTLSRANAKYRGRRTTKVEGRTRNEGSTGILIAQLAAEATMASDTDRRPAGNREKTREELEEGTQKPPAGPREGSEEVLVGGKQDQQNPQLKRPS